MDFDNAKENIQPLTAGRNASILQASLLETPQELLAVRRQLEQAIHTYEGDDPLDPWYTYIIWIEQSYPSGGKESGLDEVLKKCLARFEDKECYYQDRRMVKLYIKFLDSHKNPTECYQQLYNAGIGTMVADFYICWAYHYDACGNSRRADEVFKRGIACRAQPLVDLQEAHQHFGYIISQRLLYKDDEEANENARVQLQERRYALTSLRGYRRRAAVGSVRTGGAVKSFQPGTIQNNDAAHTSKRGNAAVPVFRDENESINRQLQPQSYHQAPSELTDPLGAGTTAESGASVVRSIIDAARNQENQHEPGPWNKARVKKPGKLFSSRQGTNSDPVFNIHVDDEEQPEQAAAFKYEPLNPPIEVTDNKLLQSFKYPAKFYNQNRRPQAPWPTPVTIENEADARTLPRYNKCMLYPRANREYQTEELRAYKYMKSRNISNLFTQKRDDVWTTRDPLANVRQYPNFAKQSRPQKRDAMDEFFVPPKPPLGSCPLSFDRIYNVEQREEFQIEELMMCRLSNAQNRTIVQPTDMEETMMVPSDRVQRRRSFFPQMRKSYAPAAVRAGRASLAPRTSIINESLSEDSCHHIPMSDATEQEPPLQTAPIALFAEVKSEFPVTDPALVERDLVAKKPILNVHGETREDTQSKEEISPPSMPALNHPPVVTKPDDSVVNEDAASNFPAKATFQPFEIYEDPTQTAPLLPKVKLATAASAVISGPYGDENDFPFKMPAALAATTTTTPTGTTTTPAVSAYDADETCSTQTFNIFLRAQSVSTPKMTQKLQMRHGASGGVCVLKDVTPIRLTSPPTTSDSADVVAVDMRDTAGAAAASPAVAISGGEENVCSPLNLSPNVVNQLSTILEISEHATTQGTTHTTTASCGTSTKSTCSSPEYETADAAVATALSTSHTRATAGIVRATELATVQEQSSESLIVGGNNSAAEIQAKIGQMTLQGPGAGSSGEQNSNLSSAAGVRAESVPEQGLEPTKEAANLQLTTLATPAQQRWMRPSLAAMTTKEALSSFTTFDHITRIEQCEDTASGYVVRPICFQEDATETIPKMLQRSGYPFADEKTDTISKMLLVPTGALLKEDKTETTMPKLPLLLPPPPPAGDGDSFEFFVASPAKVSKSKMLSASGKSFASDMKTLGGQSAAFSPLMPPPVPKRFCEQDTPELPEPPSKSGLNNRELLKPRGLPLFAAVHNNLADSFVVFSETQPSTKELPSASCSTAVVAKTAHDESMQDLSFIPETQELVLSPPLAVTSRSSVMQQVPAHGHMRPVGATTATLDDSLLPDYSLVMSSQPAASESNRQSRRFMGASIAQPREDSKHMLMESYMRDFSAIKEPHDSEEQSKLLETSRLRDYPIMGAPQAKEVGARSVRSNMPPSNSGEQGSTVKSQRVSVNKSHSNLQQQQQQQQSTVQANEVSHSTGAARNSLSSGANKFFELNAETAMFAPNISMIRNSTLLPSPPPPQQHVVDSGKATNPTPLLGISQIASNNNSRFSFLADANEDAVAGTGETTGQPEALPPPAAGGNTLCMSFQMNSTEMAFLATMDQQPVEGLVKPVGCESIEDDEFAALQKKLAMEPAPIVKEDVVDLRDEEERNGAEMSIYFKNTPKTPKTQIHTWDDGVEDHLSESNHYIHTEWDLDQTQQLLENIQLDPNMNPMQSDLQNALLERIDFAAYISKLPTCQLQRQVARLQPQGLMCVYSSEFRVVKLIGEGAFGSVYCGKETKTGQKYALKQERPANCWEYYVCLEIESRLKADDMLKSYMSVEYSLIGNNASVLVSEFSPHGSLITVCNKIKKVTMKNVDEYVVMHLTCELLEIMDHLHAIEIIHADIKADNFLLMRELSCFTTNERSLQLIDFGVSIDMKLFREGQEFTYVSTDNAFKCVEMRESRPWTYQLDLFGLAGVIHVLLFGKYMNVERRSTGIWMHTSHVPRYFHKDLWETIFRTLLNIRNCKTLPNLQQLRVLIKEELAEREKYAKQKIAEFNSALLQ